MKTITVKGGLQSFLTELRYSTTSGFHYEVRIENGKIVIKHHGGKWKAIVMPRKILVLAGDKLVIMKHSMKINHVEVDRICDTIKCYGAMDIIEKIVFAILLYNAYDDSLRWLYRWVSG